MASPPLFLAENFYSAAQFPGHVLEGGGAAVGQEVFRIGTARRSVLNGFRKADPATSIVIDLTCDRIRTADTLVLDRNSDMVGRLLTLDVFSSGDPAVQQRIFSLNVPSEVVLGSSLNDPQHLIRTSEGAWIIKFPEVAGHVWRLLVDPFEGDSGRLGGVWLGKSFSPALGTRMPFDDEETWLDFGSVRRGVPDNDVRFGRTGEFGMMLNSESEWNAARRTFRELFGKGSPMWIAPDSDKAERMWLGYNAPGSMAASFSERPQARSVVISADEYDPRLP